MSDRVCEQISGNSVPQINIVRIKVAHHMVKTKSNHLADIWCIVEFNIRLAKTAGWKMDNLGVAAIYINGPNISVKMVCIGTGFINVKSQQR